MKEWFVWISIAITAVVYYLTFMDVKNDKLKQSFATWFLWVAIDSIVLVNTLIYKGADANYKLVAFYILGGTLIFTTLFVKKQRAWGLVEWFTLALIIVCLIIWKTRGNYWAIIWSTIACFLAGIPQTVDFLKVPDAYAAKLYSAFIAANFLSFLAGKEWSIEERFYYGTCTVLVILMTLAAHPRSNQKITQKLRKIKLYLFPENPFIVVLR